MYNLVKPIQVQEELLKRKIHLFSTREFAAIFSLNEFQTEYSLQELLKEGLLERIKRGLYILKTNSPNEKEIANILYKPSYISFDYALSYYNLIPEIVYEVTSATTKTTRLFTTNNLNFGYYTIKTQAYTGYELKEEGETKFLIAEPEKAVVDYVYALTLGQRGLLGRRNLNDRLNIKNLSKEKIKSYALIFESKKLDICINKFLNNK